MKRPSVKEDLARKWVLIENFKTYIASNFNMERAKEDPDEDLDLLIANGEFAKMVKKYSIADWNSRLKYQVDTFFSNWYLDKVPCLKDVCARYDENRRNHDKAKSAMLATLEKDLGLLLTMPLFGKPDYRVKYDGSTIKIYPTEKNYHAVEVSFYKWSQDPDNDDWQYSIQVAEQSLCINPDGELSQYCEYAVQTMELACYLYHNQLYLKELVHRIMLYRKKRDAEENDYNTIETQCINDAINLLEEKAVEFYDKRNAK